MSRYLLLIVAIAFSFLPGCGAKLENLPEHILNGEPQPVPFQPGKPQGKSPTYLVSGSRLSPRKELSPAERTAEELRKASARTLSSFGPAVLPQFIAQLNAGSPAQQRQAARMIAAQGPAAIPAVESLVLKLEASDTPSDLQVLCIRALGQVGPALWPERPTPPARPAGLPTVSLEPAGVELIGPPDPTQARWQAAQLAYETDMAEYQRRYQLAQRAVAVVARILQQNVEA